MFKRCQIVVLSTEKASNIWKSIFNNTINYSKELTKTHIPQELYITSDEKIKLNDWYIDDVDQVRQNFIDDKEYWAVRKDYKKVISSTDKSLNLPQPSDSFIKAYIEAYNSGNPITKVMVEYEEVVKDYHLYSDLEIYQEKIKVDKNNTITIRKIKEEDIRITNFKQFLKERLSMSNNLSAQAAYEIVYRNFKKLFETNL